MAHFLDNIHYGDRTWNAMRQWQASVTGVCDKAQFTNSPPPTTATTLIDGFRSFID